MTTMASVANGGEVRFGMRRRIDHVSYYAAEEHNECHVMFTAGDYRGNEVFLKASIAEAEEALAQLTKAIDKAKAMKALQVPMAVHIPKRVLLDASGEGERDGNG